MNLAAFHKYIGKYVWSKDIKTACQPTYIEPHRFGARAEAALVYIAVSEDKTRKKKREFRSLHVTIRVQYSKPVRRPLCTKLELWETA